MMTYAYIAAVFTLLSASCSEGFVIPHHGGAIAAARHHHQQATCMTTTSSMALSSSFQGNNVLSVRPVSRVSQHVGPLQMNLADRFIRVAKANLNSVLQKWEDPEKVLEQATEDMQRDLIKIRQSYAEVSSSQKRMIKQKEHADKLAEEWYRRAQLALQKGDDNLAREALTRRQAEVDTAAGLQQQITVQENSISSLFEAMRMLEGKITEARAKKDNLIARARTAKTATKVNDMLGNVSGTTSMDAFERMEQKVESLEATAEVSAQLTGTASGSLESQFALLESGSKVDNELAALKNLLMPAKETSGSESGASSESGSSNPTTFHSSAAVDDELSKMRKEMSSGGAP